MMRLFLTPFEIICLNRISIGMLQTSMMIMESLSTDRYLYKASGSMIMVVIIAGMN